MSERRAGFWRRLLGAREAGLALAIILVIAVIVALDDQRVFFQRGNQTNMLRQIGLLGVFAVGEAVVIIAGGIDLSVGSLIAFAGICGTLVMRRLATGLPDDAALPLGILGAGAAACLAIGLLIGLFHALLINRLGLPPFIATLGTLSGLRSAAELLNGAVPVTCRYPNFRALSSGLNPLLVFAVVAVGVALLMRRSCLGRQITALGGNEEAARLSGLNTARLKTAAYCASSGLAALAGLLYASYTGQGDSRAGVGYELQAIAAVVVGGCSLNGGVGSVSGVMLGVVLLQVTLNGIFIIVKHNSTQWQGLVIGAVVIGAVALNNLRQRRLARA